ncbi:MAG: 50S ribosomal protein L22 [Candidatus Omnitrophota bacterium]|nr:50S ribosomal protein L22 [Candidatus Omnitrophota bacterium]
MLAKAKAKYLRISARKARLVLDLVKGKTLEEANSILDSVNKRASVPIKKVLSSAFANVNQGKQEKLLSKDVFISVIRADGGPMLARFRAATMGRATPVRHRTAHIYVELDRITSEKGTKKDSGSK